MIEIIETGLPKTIALRLSGTLHDADYKSFVPAVERIMAGQGKVRVFMEFQDLRGWDLHAAWDDLKFGLKHYADFERIALVGKRRWQKWMAQVWKPFTRARVRYFDASRVEDAWTWLREGIQPQTSA